MINFNLMECQLDDVRRAVGDYLDSVKAGEDTAKGPNGNPYHANEHHALRKLANEVVAIVLDSGVESG